MDNRSINNKKVERVLYKKIGNRLLARRRELHYTQEKMAELLEISAGFYGMIERGEKAPSIEKLVVIYERLGMDITYLLTGNEKQRQYDNCLDKCPKEKRHDFEQLIKHALNLLEIQ